MRIAVALALVLTACGPNHPSDEALVKSFNANRATFETLREMTAADAGLVSVRMDTTNPEDPATVGVSKERIQRYRDLCRAAGLEGYIENAGGMIWFHATAYRPTVNGWKAGYVYRDTKPVTSADGSLTYHSIEGNWYLYRIVKG